MMITKQIDDVDDDNGDDENDDCLPQVVWSCCLPLPTAKTVILQHANMNQK
jgi:hypothetical protein